MPTAPSWRSKPIFRPAGSAGRFEFLQNSGTRCLFLPPKGGVAAS